MPVGNKQLLHYFLGRISQYYVGLRRCVRRYVGLWTVFTARVHRPCSVTGARNTLPMITAREHIPGSWALKRCLVHGPCLRPVYTAVFTGHDHGKCVPSTCEHVPCTMLSGTGHKCHECDSNVIFKSHVKQITKQLTCRGHSFPFAVM